jgi:predicted ATPase
MQRIVIKNFGPIKDVDIPIHDFMIFIGPQASGKSTIAKAIYFFRNNLTGSLFTSLLDLKSENNIDISKKKIFDNIIDKFQVAWKYYPTGMHEIQFFYSEENWIKLKLKKVVFYKAGKISRQTFTIYSIDKYTIRKP